VFTRNHSGDQVKEVQMGENRTTFRGLVDKPKVKNPLDELSIDGRIT
jgi:hypothetical protein